jgi:enamine deaminase RidA (YjgF/YER057c/UK114 family)
MGDSIRVSLMLTPQGRGSLRDQVLELLTLQEEILSRQRHRMVVTSQTVFLRNLTELIACRELMQQHFGANWPATNFVFEPPCCGAALAIESWAIGGPGTQLKRFGPNTAAVEYNGNRWVYCTGVTSPQNGADVYHQTRTLFERINEELAQAASAFSHVVRTWFYLGSITETDNGAQRYKEFNRARTDFYRDIEFRCSLSEPSIPQGIYPASTGIGMQGRDLVGSCIALETRRPDALLLPLENPQQTPAYAYHPRFSPHSPKFSRGMALVLGDYLTTWVSGTASVLYSKSLHPGDIAKQTEQTIDNIQRLISSENFGFHGIDHSGSALGDLAKIRVYLKRPQDFSVCKAICDERFGAIPAIYAVADVCRPELLVEIEGVAFSSRKASPS